MKQDPHDAGLAKLAYLLHDLPELQGRPVADCAEYVAELGLSDSATETVLRLMAQLADPRRAAERIIRPEVPPGCPIDWTPSVLYPVFSYFQHYGPAEGAPGPMEVFYPSRRWITSRFDTAFLECGRYPLVLFLHGHCRNDVEHYKRWVRLPYNVARCGYVVAVPHLPGIAGGRSPFVDVDLDLAEAILAWLRTGWEHRDHLLPAPATAVVGHSYGALLGARLAARAGAQAYVGLSGGWLEWNDAEFRVLLGLDMPGLFAWGSGDDLFAQLDNSQLWNAIKPPKHKLVFDRGGHWDYLYRAPIPCAATFDQGPCSLVPSVAADYTSLFLSRYLPPAGAGIDGLIPPSLIPPPVARTALQDLLASWHLEGLARLAAAGEECQVSLTAEPAFLFDRSAEFQTPAATGAPTACVIPGLGVYNIAYRDTSGRLHELWRDAQGGTGTTDLTANAGAPTAAGNPFAYVDTVRNTEILLFRGGDGTVRSLYWSTGPVGHDNLSGSAGAPKAAGDPIGYYQQPIDIHHVIYRTGNGHLHELWWAGVAPVAHGGDLTALAGAPAAVGQPAAFFDGAGFNLVIFRSGDGHIRSLFWTTGAVAHEDLSGFAGTPPATSDPFGYYTAHDDTHQIVYVGNDGHLWELYWQGVAPVAGWDLTANANAPAPAGEPVAYFSAGTNSKHVVYRSSDGKLHQIRWVPGGGVPVHVELTAAYQAPGAADVPAAFAVDSAGTQHVAYRAGNGHIFEIRL